MLQLLVVQHRSLLRVPLALARPQWCRRMLLVHRLTILIQVEALSRIMRLPPILLQAQLRIQVRFLKGQLKPHHANRLKLRYFLTT